MMLMNITIGYEMDEEERDSILEENGCSVDDYDSEDEAYMEAAELKFNEGLEKWLESNHLIQYASC